MLSLLWLSLLAPLGWASPVGTQPVPIVIWHGLGDRADSAGLLALAHDLKKRPALKNVFVHIVYLDKDGSADSRSTFFGNGNEQIDRVCNQLLSLDEITSPVLNPSGKFDAIGFSQGGQFLRGLVERCGPALKVRNLITLGSQHMGISSLPPCPPNASIFSSCRLSHSALVKNGIYSSFAQNNLIFAQYFRDEVQIDKYLNGNNFLRDLNNERIGDREVGPPSSASRSLRRFDQGDEPIEPRNQTYKDNFSSLQRLVLFRFSLEQTVAPPQSAHFTLPSPNATNCDKQLPNPTKPCYLDPVPYSDLPLYVEDYIGLRKLDEGGRVVRDVCEGTHMEIDRECWESVVSWLGKGDGTRSPRRINEPSIVWQL